MPLAFIIHLLSAKPQGYMKSKNMFINNAHGWTSPFGLQITTVKMRGYHSLLSIFNKTNNLNTFKLS